ncbi:hypothetical protein ZIOFF_059713 [Zingiber officinale]|uniref:Uncharacterized protein n=1 Tax=Zingiber officinale TaxID=94328 RepID=A0A8J5FAN7_ZINOF|nr:hypothetical protein ZIOFF_059713 [Zingiber officinale]
MGEETEQIAVVKVEDSSKNNPFLKRRAQESQLKEILLWHRLRMKRSYRLSGHGKKEKNQKQITKLRRRRRLSRCGRTPRRQV